MLDVEKSIVDKKIIKKVIDNRDFNEIIIKYYKKLFNDDVFLKEFSILHGKTEYKNIIFNKLIYLSNCNKFWSLDRYDNLKVKDLISQNLCRDKFCNNCKKVLQSARLSKYVDELSMYDNKLYHLVLTVPNCGGENLRSTILHMNRCFKYLINYIRCKLNTSGVDFSSWGYEGAIRSLEVTFDSKSYHPHFHVALALREDILSEKKIVNSYSYSYSRLKSKFSEEEVLIQKIWFLLINKIRVNKKNIDNLDLGYSCKIDKFEKGQYYELFKYITKEVDENRQVLSYENFKTLYRELYNLKQIQGYGCFFSVKDNLNLDEFNKAYDDLKKLLNEKEKPTNVSEALADLLVDNKYTLISRKSAHKYLRDVN